MNSQKFLKFLSTKTFENIFDLDINDPENDRYTYCVNRTTHKVEWLPLFPTSRPKNNNNPLLIFKDKRYNKFLWMYKELQYYNNIKCCSYLCLAPLFLSVSEIMDFLQQHETDDNRYDICFLLNKLIYRIYISVPKSLRKIISLKCRLYRDPVTRYLYIKGFQLDFVQKILNSIGLNFTANIYDYTKQKILYYKDNTGYPQYFVIGYVQKDKLHIGHVEVVNDMDNPELLSQYLSNKQYFKEINTRDYKEFDDEGIFEREYNQYLFFKELSDKNEDNVDIDEKEVLTYTFEMNYSNRRIIRNRNNIRRNLNNNINKNKNIYRNSNINRRRPIILNSRNNKNNNIRRNIRNRNNINKNIKNIIKYSNPKSVNMNIKKNNMRNMVLTGKDLVVPADNKLCVNNGMYFIIPINPIYWEGTRAKNIAVLNQYYLPKKIILEYVPKVSKFQAGNITIGCISNASIKEENIENVLIASTDGCTFSCSEKFNKRISLSSLLPQKKLLITNEMSKENNPFSIYIYLNGVLNNQDILISPGMFFINYEIQFFNPVSVPLNIHTDNNILIKDFIRNCKDCTCILLQQNNNYDVGTIINVERNDQEYNFYYNNTKIILNMELKATFFYSLDFDVDNIYKYSLYGYFTSEEDQSIIFPTNTYALKIDINDNSYSVLYNVNIEDKTINTKDVYVKLFENQIPEEFINSIVTINQVKMDPQTLIFSVKGNFEDVIFVDY